MRIETDRCLIRGFEAEDIDEFMLYRNDERWMRFQSFKGLTKPEYQKVLLGGTSPRLGMQLAIVGRSDGGLIGDIYLKQEADAFWVGYTVAPRYSRQGYASEALNGVIGWISRAGYGRVCAAVLPENTASVGLLKKLGFAFSGMHGDEALYVLRLSRIK